MTKILVAGTVLTAAVVALLAAGALALPAGSQLASAQDSAARAGFAATDAAAPRVAEPKAAPAAGEPSVVISSFIMPDNNTHAGEICGHVTGAASGFTVVRVSVDPREKKPGIYNTLAGSDGEFCVVVVTYTGLAEASVAGMDKPISATAARQSGR
jgi:hypothetical protein